MCLFFEVVPNTRNVVGADRLSRLSGLAITKRAGALHFSLGGSGCGCPLLTDTADFATDFWDLEPTVIPALETALTTIAREANGFTLSALWAGDQIESESTEAFSVFLAALRENRIRNAHLYRVTGLEDDQSTGERAGAA